MLLRVEVAAFHPCRTPLDADKTRLCGPNRRLAAPGRYPAPCSVEPGLSSGIRKPMPATVWPASAAILPHRDAGGLTSLGPRRKNHSKVVLRRGDEHATQNVLPAARSGQRHPDGQRSAARASRRRAHAFPRQARDVSRQAARSELPAEVRDRKSTRLNSSHTVISYAVFCLKKKKKRVCHPGAVSSMGAAPRRSE